MLELYCLTDAIDWIELELLERELKPEQSMK